MRGEVEAEDIVIVGGGICGLATALALHRKGIRSVVLEKSETPRATGMAIILQANAWRALDQLGVASQLRHNYLPISSGSTIFLETEKQIVDTEVREGELRCIRRSELIEALAGGLPESSVRCNSKIVGVKLDAASSFPIIHLQDGTRLRAKVLIGCDGVHSVVANFLGIPPVNTLEHRVVRGFTSYEHGHNYGNEFTFIERGKLRFARFPMTDKDVYWFLVQQQSIRDTDVFQDPMDLRDAILEALRGFPEDVEDMVKKCDLEHLHLAPFKYRPPWDLLLRKRSRKGTVIVAGDAMHAMGAFIAQGGAAALEDAVVLARCLARSPVNNKEFQLSSTNTWKKMVQDALNEYEKERLLRIFGLSTNTYLHGVLFHTSSPVIRVLCILIFAVFFPNFNRLTSFDCGEL